MNGGRGPVQLDGVGLAAGALGLLVGAFLPWLTASSVFGSLSRTGLDYADGKVAAGLGVGLAILATVLLSGARLPVWLTVLMIVTAVIGSLVVAVVLVHDYGTLQDRATAIGSDVTIGSLGAGIYLSIAGAVIGFVASIAAATRPYTVSRHSPHPAGPSRPSPGPTAPVPGQISGLDSHESPVSKRFWNITGFGVPEERWLDTDTGELVRYAEMLRRAPLPPPSPADRR